MMQAMGVPSALRRRDVTVAPWIDLAGANSPAGIWEARGFSLFCTVFYGGGGPLLSLGARAGAAEHGWWAVWVVKLKYM